MAEKEGRRSYAALSIITHVLAWLPLLWMVWNFWQGTLGINPVRALTLRTGKIALILLLLSLSSTPLKILFGWNWAVFPLRRLLGLYAFVYAAIHFLIFVGLDYAFDLALVSEALRTNRFTLPGLVGLLILLPLALTSSRRAISWLGEKWWKWLHRWVYLAAVLVLIHYALLVRQHYTQPIIYGVVLLVLFGVRLAAWHGRNRASASSSA